MTTTPNVDLREALYNDRPVGTVGQVQLPREAVTRLHGLMVDLDANVLTPNRWFPPAEDATRFHTAISPVLYRHPILRYAEVRDTGRWLHAITWFSTPVELHTTAEQKRWTALHRLLMGSVPSDPAAQPLIALTRPLNSTNSKTGRTVATLKPGEPISPDLMVEWAARVQTRPFKEIAMPLFGNTRVAPCPYCLQPGSHLDVGDQCGMCYGPCRKVPITRVFSPVMGNSVAKKEPRSGKKAAAEVNNNSPQGVRISGDTVLEIEPGFSGTITVKKKGD